MDGVYKETLAPQSSGTASAWITFQADECATPIIEGQGVGPDMDDPNGVGVYSATAEYIRFVGLVLAIIGTTVLVTVVMFQMLALWFA